MAPTSTRARYITAKGDNDRKPLVWGVITDANEVMRIRLRDFRSHVGMLDASGCRELAVGVSQGYLHAYARGLKGCLRHLIRISRTSRETGLRRPEQDVGRRIVDRKTPDTVALSDA